MFLNPIILNKNRVFISYSTEDRAAAEVVSNIFVQCGFYVWIDYQNLNLWQCVKKQILHELENCDLFILILSPSSKASSWVQFEWNQAHKFRKPAFVVDIGKKYEISASFC